jgi:hypothetical protein
MCHSTIQPPITCHLTLGPPSTTASPPSAPFTPLTPSADKPRCHPCRLGSCCHHHPAMQWCPCHAAASPPVMHARPCAVGSRPILTPVLSNTRATPAWASEENPNRSPTAIPPTIDQNKINKTSNRTLVYSQPSVPLGSLCWA